MKDILSFFSILFNYTPEGVIPKHSCLVEELDKVPFDLNYIEYNSFTYTQLLRYILPASSFVVNRYNTLKANGKKYRYEFYKDYKEMKKDFVIVNSNYTEESLLSILSSTYSKLMKNIKEDIVLEVSEENFGIQNYEDQTHSALQGLLALESLTANQLHHLRKLAN